jgi:hypothetical protein
MASERLPRGLTDGDASNEYEHAVQGEHCRAVEYLLTQDGPVERHCSEPAVGVWEDGRPYCAFHLE